MIIKTLKTILLFLILIANMDIGQLLTSLFSAKEAEAGQKIDLTPSQRKLVDSIIYAEAAGGNLDEIKGVASTMINRIAKDGFDKAVKGYSSYNKKSKQFVKASTGDLNDYEKKIFSSYSTAVQSLLDNPDLVSPYTHHENIKAFGEPYWAKGQSDFKDIGRQRFYTINE